MCAIFGEIDYNTRAGSGIDTHEITSSMRHRGPDQDGAVFCGHAALLHTRLCVIDVENGRQPMSFRANGQEYTIVYNGELYNTAELRKELEAYGFCFNGHSDTEVALKAYVRWGEDCVNKFNGIFAFAVWESGTQELFVARDRMGVKPFFYSLAGGKFIFASEIKSILKHPLVKPEIDINSVAEIMLLGPGRTPGCGVFKHIDELPPAHCGRYTPRGLEIRRYWRVADREHTDSFEDTVAKVRELICDSIRRQLVSDVPLGSFLSGGLDSSIIAAVAAERAAASGDRLKTFSVFYKDNEKYFKKSKFQPNSDSDYIDIVCAHLGCENVRVVIDTQELVSALFDAVDARDLPGMADVDSALLLACREVKKYCTVVLSGECADEIFGGYPWYRDKSIRESEGFPWAQSTMWRYRFIRKDLREKINPQEYLYERYRRTVLDTDVSHTASEQERKTKIMLNLNMQWFMQTLLDRKDRMSMYSGLEARVPFCDYRIVEYLYSVPWEFKDCNNCEKGLLREAFKDMLPDAVLWRKKSPFPKTHNPAYQNTVSALLGDILSNPNEPIFEIADRDMLETLPNSQNQTPWYGQLMTVPQTIAYFLQLNYWLKKYRVTITP
jgi:asparagine synthase (glutamine-hydrolysing)